MSDRIDVTGNGSAQAAPDVATARLAAEVRAGTVQEALDGAGSASAAMAGAARAQGIGDADIATGDTRVDQELDHKGVALGYRAWLGLDLRMHDVATVGDVLGAVLGAGGDAARLQSLALAASEPAEAVAAAREAAMADARTQAEHLAALAGRPLGEVRRISISPSYGQPVFRAARQTGMALAAMPVEAGTTTVTVSVEVRFDLG